MKLFLKWLIVIAMCTSIIFTMTGCKKEIVTSDDNEVVGTKAADVNITDNSIQVTASPEDNSKDKEKMEFREDLQVKFDNLKLNEAYKEIGNHNPLITQDFGADPFAMVYDGRVYVYMTQDVYMYDGNGNIKENSYGEINSLRCISSSDLVNWTDHGQIHIGGIKGVSLWAKNSWAPSAIWKELDGKDQFFVYFANGAGGIGVLTADSPTGPFRDSLGEALITHQTPNCSGVVWLFDPAVFTDEDGTSYLYFGGGIPEGQAEAPKTARVIELGPDMMSTVGEAVSIDAPYLFEDSGINKIGNTYYYTYCSNFSSRADAKGSFVPDAGEIIYMTSDNPMGPWEYQGSILKNPGHFFGTGGNNHHSMVQFNEKWYIFYHAFLLQDAIGVKGGYRSTNMNEVIMNADGSIQSIQADKAGVEQINAINPYEEIEATTMSNNAGISVVEEDRKNFKEPVIVSVADIESGDWIQVSGVDFGEKGAADFTIRFSCESDGGAIKVCKDNLDGEAITYAEITNTGSYKDYVEVTVPVKDITEIHDIYFVFTGSGFHLNSWSFTEKYAPEDTYEELFNEKDEDYKTMIENSLITTGNNFRMKKVIEKAQKGEEITIAYIGGSITEGAGATKNSDCYAYQSYQYFKNTYGVDGGSNVKFVNAGMGGTPSALGIIRYDRDVTAYGQVQPDLVFIEFAVNDYQEPTNGEAYESLVKKVLSTKNQSAVVLIFSVFKSRWNMQDLYKPIGNYYELPMISIKDAVVPELSEGRITDEEFFSDEYHPTDLGHKIMTDSIKYYFNTVNAELTAEEDIAPQDIALLGNSFEKIKILDSETTDKNASITLGSFNKSDNELCVVAGLNRKTFPDNWKHDSTSGTDSFVMTLTCKNLLFVYKSSSNEAFGTADIYIDGKLITNVDSKQGGGWNNPVTLLLLKEESAEKHTIEIKMAEGSENKEFSILAFGYTQ